MRDIVDIFATLGVELQGFGRDATTSAIIDAAIEHNPWFTKPDIERAVEAIRIEMLDRTKFYLWLSNYTPVAHPERVAIIMAGNIPLVGFFDLLCVICSGHKAYIKPSSKDTILMNYIADTLRIIEPDIAIYDYSSEEQYDRVIATGGEEANRYFESHFKGTKRLLRGSRHSVAVLSGTESADELMALTEDITAYSGLGCRSVSMIFAPEGYNLSLPYTDAVNPKLRRNIASIRALYTLQQRPFEDFGAYLAVEGKTFSESLALVVVQRYNDMSQVERWLQQHSTQIQCIVSNCSVDGCIALGQAQYPTLWDYADGVDTMKFLTEYRWQMRV